MILTYKIKHGRDFSVELKNIANRPCIDRLHTDRDVCKGTTDSPKVALA